MAHGITRYWYGICILILLLGCYEEGTIEHETEYITHTETIWRDYDFIDVPLEENQYTITLTQEEIDTINNGGVLNMRVFAKQWYMVKAETTFTDCKFIDVIYGGDKFVAVGYKFDGSFEGKIIYSSDGITWSSVATSSFGSSIINGIAYSGSRYVAVGHDGKMAYSSDGTSWSQVGSPPFGSEDIGDICYGDGKFVACTKEHADRIAYSTNGTDWTAASSVETDASGDNNVMAVTYGEGVYVVVGLGGYSAYSSDADTWTYVYVPFYTPMDIYDIAYGNGLFVAPGTDGYFAYSEDGTSWTVSSETWSSITSNRAIGYGDSRFVAGSNPGGVARSLDGEDWTFGQEDIGYEVSGIAYGNGKFVLVGYGETPYYTP